MAIFQKVSIGRDAAIKLGESGWWKRGNRTPREICRLQYFTEEVIMDWSDFKTAVAKFMEWGETMFNADLILREEEITARILNDGQGLPTRDEILNLAAPAPVIAA